MSINLGNTQISPTEMTVNVVKSVGIKAWLAIWTFQPDDFEDGREFVQQHRDLTDDPRTDEKTRPTKSGTKLWSIPGDGLFEFGNVPTKGGSQTRGFLLVENGDVTRLPYSKKKELIEALPVRPRTRRTK